MCTSSTYVLALSLGGRIIIAALLFGYPTACCPATQGCFSMAAESDKLCIGKAGMCIVGEPASTTACVVSHAEHPASVHRVSHAVIALSSRRPVVGWRRDRQSRPHSVGFSGMGGSEGAPSQPRAAPEPLEVTGACYIRMHVYGVFLHSEGRHRLDSSEWHAWQAKR